MFDFEFKLDFDRNCSQAILHFCVLGACMESKDILVRFYGDFTGMYESHFICRGKVKVIGKCDYFLWIALVW